MNAYVTERAPRTGASPLSAALVVVAYVAGFFGALPSLLWAIGGRLDRLLVLPSIEGRAMVATGAVLFLAGIAFMGSSMASLSLRGRGLPISHLPPASLVVRGPHARMRHPIYVGYTSAFAGIGIATGSLGRGVLASGLLYAGSIIYALAFEEPRLRARFGAAYTAYADRVPAFPFSRAAFALVSRVWRPIRGPVERLANRVVWFRLGDAIFVTYGAFAAAGAGLGLAILHVLFGAALRPAEEIAYFVGIVVFILAWARIVALLYRARALLFDPGGALRSVGFVSWGGYIGLFSFPFAFAWVYSHHDGAWLMDRTFVAALVCSCLGRIGCLTYGCCYGAKSAHGIAWTHPDAKPHRELFDAASAAARRVPTQLVSALYVALAIPIVVAVIQRAAPGVATLVGAIAYTTARFAVECRRDEPRFTRLLFTRGQLFAIAGAAGAIGMLLALPLDGAARPIAVIGPLAPAGWAAAALGAAITFVVCGVHWRRVGRW